MIYGIVSDIHGNLRALDSVLRAFEKRGVDRIICLGDMIGYYHQSSEVIARLMSAKAKCLMGNHEAYLLGLLEVTSEKRQVCLLDQVKESVSESQYAWLSSLSKALEIGIDGGTFGFFHGSPWDPLEEYVYENSTKWSSFTRLPYDHVFLGHTHQQMLKQVGDVTIINPGSCGQPRNGDMKACAATFDTGKSQVKLVSVRYDVKSFLREARTADVSERALSKLEECVKTK